MLLFSMPQFSNLDSNSVLTLNLFSIKMFPKTLHAISIPVSVYAFANSREPHGIGNSIKLLRWVVAEDIPNIIYSSEIYSDENKASRILKCIQTSFYDCKI